MSDPNTGASVASTAGETIALASVLLGPAGLPGVIAGGLIMAGAALWQGLAGADENSKARKEAEQVAAQNRSDILKQNKISNQFTGQQLATEGTNLATKQAGANQDILDMSRDKQTAINQEKQSNTAGVVNRLFADKTNRWGL